ncbi:MAG: antitoxin family protein [bacterium]|nr:antitoxin family protein [bacterium]
MITKPIEATYDDGALRLAEPLDLAPRSRVRVRIEIPSSLDPSSELMARLNDAYADTPDEDERMLQKHMARRRREQAEEW